MFLKREHIKRFLVSLTMLARSRKYKNYQGGNILAAAPSATEPKINPAMGINGDPGKDYH